MLISLQNNLAILAMTKTGSTSVETALAPFCDILFTHDPRVKHIQYRRFERFIQPYLKSLGYGEVRTTCLFRDPVDWLGSWYRYRSRPALRGQVNSTAEMSFETFVENYLSDTPDPFAKVGRQSQFVLRQNGDIGIDHLFRYEDIASFQSFLSDVFRREIELPRLNESPKQRLDLSKPLLAELQKTLSQDFEIYESLS